MERSKALSIPNGEHLSVMSRVMDEVDQGDSPLKEYTDACRDHIWLIIIIGVCFTAAAAAWSLLQTPIYEARATVVIESQGPGWLEKDKSHYVDNSPDYFQTHFELLKSHYVLQRTAQVLDLQRHPEYQPPSSPVRDWIKTIVPKSIQELLRSTGKAATDTGIAAEEALVRRFSENVGIMPIRGARLAHVTVSSTDPAFAAQAANTLVSVYIDRNQELSSASREQAARWLTNHLDELRQKVQTSQQALYLYRVKHGLHSGEERKSLASHTLAELNSQLVRSEMATAEVQSRFQQIKSVLGPHGQDASNVDWSRLDSYGQVLNSHLIQTLRAQEITVSAQVAELSEKYGPLHPKLTHMKAELQDLRQRIQQEVQKIYDSVKHEYNMALAQHRAVKEAISRYNTDKIRFEHSEVEQSMLEREAESNQHLYDMFLRTTKETDLSAGMSTNNVYLADPARISSIPAKPKTKLNIVLALTSGLMTGVGLAISWERRGRKLRAPADLERSIPSVSLLGVVPMLGDRTTTENALVHPHAMTPAAESYRIIRTSLLLSKTDSLPYRVLITSPGENEGKTTLSINLAMTMAQLEGMKVILVDMDFRNPIKHPIYEVGRKGNPPRGLVHLLRGEASLHDVIHSGLLDNLSIIPCGDRPNNPTELLYSPALTQLLDWALKNKYHLIMDCPPVLPIADASVVASRVDGVLMVVSAGETTRDAYRSAIQRVTFSGGRILGVVLQKARIGGESYYSYGGALHGHR